MSDNKKMVNIPEDPYRLKFHLMPPTGWMNDPNGLCWFRGYYHVFFQYAPASPTGGPKSWGHYMSPDLLHWTFCGEALKPREEYDSSSIFSGSSVTVGDRLYAFYTGIVRDASLPREEQFRRLQSNTACAVSDDGIHFCERHLVIATEDYPKEFERHIRDPKVWEENGMYYMVLGARSLEGKGHALLYAGSDPLHPKFQRAITTQEPFGFMWECPDVFSLGGKQILSMSPEGLEAEEYRYQNTFQCGYFVVDGDIRDAYKLENFREWDHGFDFYAAQTFEDHKGRRILMAWASVSRAPYENPTVEQGGWQHALTVPRELTLRNGKLYQNPVEELKQLRDGSPMPLKKGTVMMPECFECELTGLDSEKLTITLGQGVTASYEEGVFALSLTREAGYGRDIRKIRLSGLNDLRILADTSLLEIYLNEGEEVFTTRYYMTDRTLEIASESERLNGSCWNLKCPPVENMQRKK